MSSTSSPKQNQQPDLHLLRSELEGYIAAAEGLEDENSRLHLQIGVLHAQMEEERAAMKQTFRQAKESWKEQALQFIERKEKRRRGAAQTETQSSSSLSSSSSQSSSFSQSSSSSLALETEVRSLRLLTQHLRRVESVHESLKKDSPGPLLMDFSFNSLSLAQNNGHWQGGHGHVGVFNNTRHTLRLQEHYIKFHYNSNSKSNSRGSENMKYMFRSDAILSPGEHLSLWWGKAARPLHYPQGGSLHWDAAVSLPPPPPPLSAGARAAGVRLGLGRQAVSDVQVQLWRADTLIAWVGPNVAVCDDVSMDTAVEVPSKRRRISSSPSPKCTPRSSSINMYDSDKDLTSFELHSFLLGRKSGPLRFSLAQCLPSMTLSTSKSNGKNKNKTNHKEGREVVLQLQNCSDVASHLVGWQLHLLPATNSSGIVISLPELHLPANGELVLLSSKSLIGRVEKVKRGELSHIVVPQLGIGVGQGDGEGMVWENAKLCLLTSTGLPVSQVDVEAVERAQSLSQDEEADKVEEEENDNAEREQEEMRKGDGKVERQKPGSGCAVM